MPNWCSNYLRVSGDIPELVEKFYHFAQGKGLYWDENGVGRVTDDKAETQALDFAQFLYPEGVDGSFSDVGWDWCIDHWGTKWQGSLNWRRLRNWGGGRRLGRDPVVA